MCLNINIVIEATPEIPDSAAHKYLGPQKDLHEIYKDVTKNIEDHLNNETLPKLEKKKPNQYGLTPGATPFPDHVGQLAEKCEEVNRLLLKVDQIQPETVLT